MKAFGWCGLSEKVVQPKTFQPDRLLRLCITVILRVKWQKVLFKCWHRSIQCILSMIHAQPCLCTCTTLLCAATPHLPLHSVAITSQKKLRERLEVVNYHCFVPMFTIDVHTWCCPVYFPMPFQTNCSINTICMLYHVKVLFSNCPNLWSFAFSCSCAISANLYLFPVTLHTLIVQEIAASSPKFG